jgi:hypothetical protein
MFRHPLLWFFLIFCTSCSNFPADPQSTLKRVKTERSFRVGLVASPQHLAADPKVRSLLKSIGQATGASPREVEGEADVLFSKLEAGELDLVVGRFKKKTPWSRMVTLGPPLRLAREGEAEIVLAPAAPNGENAWIAVIERAARDVSPEAQ